MLRSGVPALFACYIVDCARAMDPAMLFKLMQSTFISYGAPDAAFARTLYEGLKQNGVRAYLFEEDATPGERLHRVMFEGVNKYDRVLLICSAASLSRPGVKNEIEETFARESRDGGASYLIPITRDNYVFEWADSMAVKLRDRVIADFRDTDRDRRKFNSAFQRLLRALRVEPASATARLPGA